MVISEFVSEVLFKFNNFLKLAYYQEVLLRWMV